jgi:spore coat protein CotH
MRRMSLAIAVALPCLLGPLAVGVPDASAQSAGDLFNAGTLQEIRLFVNSKDLAQLRARYAENIFFPADLQWGSTRVRNVAIRSRGSGSRNPTKMGLLVEFDHYTTGQTFVGLKSLVLDNAWQDPSMMREQIAMAFFNRMGQAAPREAFCKLYINNVPQGLYVLVENIDANFLTRALGDNNGYLFEFHWQSNAYFYANDLGDDLNAYKPLFEPRTHTLETDQLLYAPIRDLFKEVNGPDDAVWRTRVEEYLDLNQFVTSVAIEIFLAEYDGLTGNWGMNNFYFYRRGTGTTHQFLPWDRDYSMIGQFDSSIFLNTAPNLLFQRAMAFEDLRNLFLTTLELCAQRATEDDWLAAEIGRSTSLTAGPAHDDTRKQFPNEDYDKEVAFLLDFAQRRPAYVLQEVAKARGGGVPY